MRFPRSKLRAALKGGWIPILSSQKQTNFIESAFERLSFAGNFVVQAKEFRLVPSGSG